MEENSSKKPTASIEYTKCGLDTHSFSEKIGSDTVLFSVLKMKDSILIWIGSAEAPTLVNLCLAMNSHVEGLPITTKILGPGVENMSVGLASNLTKKLNKPVYVSLNIEVDRLLFPEVSKRLKEEINKNPCYF